MPLLQRLRDELEAPPQGRRFGQGWISGTLGVVLGAATLGGVLCLRYPSLLTTPEIRAAIDVPTFRIVLMAALVLAFVLGGVSAALRQNKLLGFTAMAFVLVATALGGSGAHAQGETPGSLYFGLDWFFLNLILSGIVFLPLERAFGRTPQAVFRPEWREDLLYFFLSSVLVQSLTFLTFAPSKALLAHTDWDALRTWVRDLPLAVQVPAIMFLTDLVQYWVHRVFHQVPFLWRFHAIHHSAPILDWIAGSRMHVMEIVCLRALTVMPTMLLGFHESAVQIYLVVVYLYATWLHANLRFDVEWIKPILATPRFHHWHHGLGKEAIDVNFAIHFPVLDRVFGTYHMPKGRWPSGYGVDSHRVPSGFVAQFLDPFRRKQQES
ncbi:MAG: sterol desaturase family protein [Planctomycetes bacterium]|nr:sterol desaturase family protein [Planctomycetota bacterium]